MCDITAPNFSGGCFIVRHMKATNPSHRIKRTKAVLRRIGFQSRFLDGTGAEA
jgi:hypothetical protein